MECIAIEMYFASVGDTQTFITQYIREQGNVGISGKLSFKTRTHTGNSFLLWTDLLWKLDGVYSCWKALLRQPVTLKPLLHNSSANRET